MPFIVCAEAGVASIEDIKAMGYTHVRIDAVWALDELSEGRLDLSGLHEMLEKAELHGLGAILRLDIRKMPPWLGDKYPEAHRRRGAVCPFYPGVMSDTLFYTRTIIKELAKHDVIAVWELKTAWESGCCEFGCDDSISAFRDHLRTIYPTIKAFNEAYNLKYMDFTDIYPVNDALTASFLNFQSIAPAVRLAEIAWAIQEGDSHRRPVIYITPVLTPEDAVHPWDDVALSETRQVEFFNMLRQMDRKRAVNGPNKPLLAELHYPHGFMGHYAPTAHDADRAFAAAALGGADGIIVGQGANETVLKACGQWGRHITNTGALDKPRALIVSQDHSEEMTTYAERAYHALLTACGVTADIGTEYAEGYEIVIWPACAALDIGQLKAALNGDRHVLIEALPPLLANGELCALLGVTPGDPVLVSEPDDQRFLPKQSFDDGRLPPCQLTGKNELEGDLLRASLYYAPLECAEGTRPLFTLVGQAAAVIRDIGSCRVILAATCLSYAASAHADLLSGAALKGLMALLGAKDEYNGVVKRKRGMLSLAYNTRDEVFTVETL